jgi:hypothetical protein
MDKIVAISERTGKNKLIYNKFFSFQFSDGRDKFTKAIQYGSRFLAFYMSGKNPDWEKRFKALFSMIDFIILKFFKNFTPSPCERFKKNLQTFQECK